MRTKVVTARSCVKLLIILSVSLAFGMIYLQAHAQPIYNPENPAVFRPGLSGELIAPPQGPAWHKLRSFTSEQRDYLMFVPSHQKWVAGHRIWTADAGIWMMGHYIECCTRSP